MASYNINQYIKLVLLFSLLIFQSCISATPDCDDLNKQELKSKLIEYENNELTKEYFKLLDALKSYWKAQGFKEATLRDDYATSVLNPKFHKTKNDSLGQLWVESTSRLKTIWLLKKDSLLSTNSNLKFLDKVTLITENENISLTEFHCNCSIQYVLGEKTGEIQYKLTRRDWDSQTYHKVNHATLKSNSIITKQVWESLITKTDKNQ